MRRPLTKARRGFQAIVVPRSAAMSAAPSIRPASRGVAVAINGTVVASYDKSLVVAPGKLKSTDGVYGIRFSHNTEGVVSGLTVTKP